ncbi:MAG: hypothetical protein ABFS41_00715 [Myxococcota bacterium]
MEKLAYVVWKRADEAEERFATRLLLEVAPRLRSRTERLRISVVDDAVAAGAKLHLGKLAPSGLVSFWLEQSQERAACEALLASACARVAGYLVVESRPLVNRAQRAPAGARTPGFALVSCIEAKDGLAKEEFIRLWYTVQRDTAISTQSTFGYVRNEVVRALTAEAPAWDAIVEENFPIGALDDPAVFYDAVGDPERLRRHQERMFRAVQGFIALDRIESHPMSEYDFT